MSSLDDRKRARLLDINTLIAWAETKDPSEVYQYCDMRGKCFFSQYLFAHGVNNHFNPDNAPDEVNLWFKLHFVFKHCVKPEGYSYFSLERLQPMTFGRAVLKLKIYRDGGSR
jgi:allantoicase